jgi:hypothetical protein
MCPVVNTSAEAISTDKATADWMSTVPHPATGRPDTGKDLAATTASFRDFTPSQSNERLVARLRHPHPVQRT